MSRTIFGWVGDSITEGYGDSIPVSCNGIPGRLLRTALDHAGTVTTIHINMGASGMMVPQYIDIAKGLIGADPTRYTAIFCSIWSPNKPAGQPDGDWPTRAENTLAMREALIAFEAWLLERNIVFLPTFMFGSPFEMGAATGTNPRRVLLQQHLDACLALWPWLLNLNTPVQNPAVTDGPYGLAPTYCDDATHPNSLGYTTMTNYIAPLIDAAFAAAVAAYGFVEPTP